MSHSIFHGLAVTDHFFSLYHLCLSFSSESEIAALSPPGDLRKKPAEIPRASSPTPIKVDQILHKELLAETGLPIEGQVRFVPFDIISARATGL